MKRPIASTSGPQQPPRGWCTLFPRAGRPARALVAGVWALVAAFSTTLHAAPVVVSSKLSDESALIGQMILLLLEQDGIATVDRLRLGATPVVRQALLTGEVDLYVEYTANAGNFFHRSADPAWKDLDAGYRLGARLDYQANRIVWLTPARVSNAWAIAVRSDEARAHGLASLSDFGRWVRAGGHVVLACSAEFANAGTLRSLERTYAFALRPEQLIVLAGGETTAMIVAAAARTNGTNAAMVYGTDGGVAAARLRVLEDDRHDQPVYAPVPTVREAVLRAHPAIAGRVRSLMESFDAPGLQRLNERVQIDGESTRTVAQDYLRSRSLLAGSAP